MYRICKKLENPFRSQNLQTLRLVTNNLERFVEPFKFSFAQFQFKLVVSKPGSYGLQVTP